MFWFKFYSINVCKIYEYIYKFKRVLKQYSWIKFLNNSKIIWYINSNINFFRNINISDSVKYFFFNYNVSLNNKVSKMKYLTFFKQKIFVPTFFSVTTTSSYLLSFNYDKLFYKRFLYWYYNRVRPIKFKYNYNNLFKLYNVVFNKFILNYFEFYLILNKTQNNSINFNIINNILIIRIFNSIYKYFKYIYFSFIKILKNFIIIKYFNYSFLLNKIKKKYFFRKKLFLKNKNINILFIINNIIYYLFLFLLKKWVDYNIALFNNKFIAVLNYNFKIYYFCFFNKKIYNFLFLKYRILWQVLTKITYLKYFKPLHFIINYKKLNNF